jgi:hypothetical protein
LDLPVLKNIYMLVALNETYYTDIVSSASENLNRRRSLQVKFLTHNTLPLPLY